jgi:hypothetical protein
MSEVQSNYELSDITEDMSELSIEDNKETQDRKRRKIFPENYQQTLFDKYEDTIEWKDKLDGIFDLKKKRKL